MAITKIGEEMTKEAFIGGLSRVGLKKGLSFITRGAKGAKKAKGPKKTFKQKMKSTVSTPKDELGKHKMSTFGKDFKRDFTSPLSLGFMAYDTASGNASAGESVSGMAGATAGFTAASKLPGIRRLGSIGRIGAGLIGGSLGWEGGSAVGRKLDPQKRTSSNEKQLASIGGDTNLYSPQNMQTLNRQRQFNNFKQI